MKIIHDDLKRAYKSYIRSRVPLSREECPPAESIFSILDESVSSADKDKIIDHITGCCYCLQEFELFLDFYRKEEKALGEMVSRFRKKGTSSNPSRKKARLWGPLFTPRIKVRPIWRLAAASLAVIGIATVSIIGMRSFLRTPEDRERGRQPGQIQLIFPVRGERIRMPLVFRWEGTPRAEYYLLEIFDRSLLPLWKSPRIEGLLYELPSEAADIVKKNELYFWTITACLTDGTKLESSLEEFTTRE